MNPQKFDSRLLAAAGLMMILLVAAFGANLYFYLKYRQVQTNYLKLAANPQEAFRMENKNMVEKIRSLMVLPEDEDPTVAIVDSLERLKNQPFFKNAKVGDRVFIFNKAKKAVLYDPIANKIIEVGPVNVGTPSAQITGTNQESSGQGKETNPEQQQPIEPSPTSPAQTTPEFGQ